MPKYTCERCLKEFSQKSHYTKHQNKKIPCQDNKGKIEEVVENIIINKKLILNNTEDITQTIMESQSETLIKSENKIMDVVKNDKTQVIINEDCIIKMKEMKNDSVDIIICDPPYNIGKDFGNNSDKQDMDKYISWCDEWITECIRILKPKGTLYIYGFSEILAFIRVRININVRWIIWHYTNKVTPSLNHWQRTHESILCCSKEKPHFNRDDVREPYTDSFLKNAAGKVRKATKGRFSNGEKDTVYKAHTNGALPRDVIKISALSGGAGKKERVNHPTQKPLQLCEKLIKASKNGDDTLLVVPFAGSGSECVAAKKENINFIGFEINEEYVKLCNKRLDEI
jgi:site-specific DNA-methyltransferase (adenine-specific)